MATILFGPFFIPISLPHKQHWMTEISNRTNNCIGIPKRFTLFSNCIQVIDPQIKFFQMGNIPGNNHRNIKEKL